MCRLREVTIRLQTAASRHFTELVTSVADGVDGAIAIRLSPMPSKTVARSGAKTSRSKAGSKPKRPAASKRKAPARRPAPQRPSPIATAGVAVGRASRATWLLAARGVGGTARSVGRARDIDPGHRRDGIALALLGIAGVIAASSWFDAARPVGRLDRWHLAHPGRLGSGAAPADHRRRRGVADAHRTQPGIPASAGSGFGDDRACPCSDSGTCGPVRRRRPPRVSTPPDSSASRSAVRSRTA